MNVKPYTSVILRLGAGLLMGLMALSPLSSSAQTPPAATADTTAPAQPPAAPPPPPPTRTTDAAGDIPSSLLKAIQERTAEIDRRAEQLDQKEQRLKMLEQEFKQVAQENAKLRTALEQAKKATGTAPTENPLMALTKMYAQMAPEEAAPRMEKMDRALALKILAQLKPKTAAQILSGMSPETAAKFSEKLAKPAK